MWDGHKSLGTREPAILDIIMRPKDAHTLFSETVNMLIYKAKSYFAGVIKLKILRWGDYPGYSGSTQCNNNSLQRKAGRSESEEGDMTMEAGIIVRERFLKL